MQVHLKNLTTFDASRVKYFDLHEEFGFTSIVEREETVALDLNGAVIRSWPKGDQSEIWWIKMVRCRSCRLGSARAGNCHRVSGTLGAP